MFKVEGKTLTFVRGDTVSYTLTLSDANGNTVILGTNDIIYFTIKENYNSDNYIFQATASSTPATFNISANRTAVMNPGEYVFDVEVRLFSNDTTPILQTVDTCMEGKVIVLPDVTQH